MILHPNDWTQKGNIFLWRYDSNPSAYRGWHLNCDETGCDSLVSLVQAFTGLEEPAKRSIQISKPTNRHLGVPGCKRESLSDKKLVISNADKWAIYSEQGKTFLEICEDDISKLVDSISGIKHGKGDFFIGRPGNELWFWW